MRAAAMHRRRLGDVVAGLVLLAALLLPDRLTATDFGAFVAVPVEVVLGAVLFLLLPAAALRPVAAGLGISLGALTVLKLLDAGFYAALARPFDLVLDWGLAGGAWQLLTSSLGRGASVVIVLGALLVVVAVPAITTWAALRASAVLVEHRAVALPITAGLAAFWLACSATGVVVATPYPVASAASTTKIVASIRAVRDGRADQRVFATAVAADRFGDVPGDHLLTALRGKRVVLVFAESYGRVALQDPAIAPEVEATLSAGGKEIAARGLQARSGYLTSPVAGGGSWLAHATLLSGLRIDAQQRYLTLTASERLSLTEAFHRAGWNTLAVMPGVTRAWPEGAFYHYDRIWTSADLGYDGPAFGWARFPDQYTLAQLDRLSSEATATPTMSVLPLVSSHAPWTPVPPTLDWDALGDGSVYGPSLPDPEPPEAILTRDPARVRADYGHAIAYSLRSVLSYAARVDDPENLVLIVVGDHQPAPAVTGPAAGRDVPITLITGDHTVLDRIDGWGWTPGVRPADDAPVWPMEAFRDRFLDAFS